MREHIARLEQQFGMLRSKAIYYWKPFNRRRLRRFYRPFIGSGALCFDIGAHLGNRVDAWLSMGARVVALDPQPMCYQFMKKRFPNRSGLTILPLAAGEEEGEMTFHISRMYPTVSTLSGEDWQNAINSASNATVVWDEDIQVPVTTLDNLIDKYGLPQFCKIDVEGFEVTVLKGLSTPLPALSFEFLSFRLETARDCLGLLERLGKYRFNWSAGESHQLECSEWVNADKLLDNVKKSGYSDFSGDIYAQLIS